jgi:hypothetical protein
VHERLLVARVDIHAVIVDGSVDDDFLQFLQVAAHRFVVAVGDIVRLSEHGWATFHVDKSHGAVEREPKLQRIEQLHGGEVVMPEAEMLEAAA